MQIQITFDQCYCSFGDGIVHEFVSANDVPFANPCWKCSFRWFDGLLDSSVRCYAVPCQKVYRKDKNNGFWQISETVDYQEFIKMLENGG